MPQILVLKNIGKELWARIPALTGDEPVYLWTEAEKEEALANERRRCIDAIAFIE